MALSKIICSVALSTLFSFIFCSTVLYVLLFACLSFVPFSATLSLHWSIGSMSAGLASSACFILVSLVHRPLLAENRLSVHIVEKKWMKTWMTTEWSVLQAGVCPEWQLWSLYLCLNMFLVLWCSQWVICCLGALPLPEPGFSTSRVWWTHCRALKETHWEFPGSPVVRTQRFHCRGPRFNPWSRN